MSLHESPETEECPAIMPRGENRVMEVVDLSIEERRCPAGMRIVLHHDLCTPCTNSYYIVGPSSTDNQLAYDKSHAMHIAFALQNVSQKGNLFTIETDTGLEMTLKLVDPESVQEQRGEIPEAFCKGTRVHICPIGERGKFMEFTLDTPVAFGETIRGKRFTGHTSTIVDYRVISSRVLRVTTVTGSEYQVFAANVNFRVACKAEVRHLLGKIFGDRSNEE